jgi:hypothetical protein
MKAKKIQKKLDLKKSTIARVDRDQLKKIQGAGTLTEWGWWCNVPW